MHFYQFYIYFKDFLHIYFVHRDKCRQFSYQLELNISLIEALSLISFTGLVRLQKQFESISIYIYVYVCMCVCVYMMYI